MGNKFRNILLDFVVLGMTVLALILHVTGFAVGPWWTHTGPVGESWFGMWQLRLCQFSCVDKTVLVLEGGTEWALIVRVFEVFGIIFLLLALLMALLAVTVRLRTVHTSVVYIHGAAALFILLGVFIFLGFNKTLNQNLDGEGSVRYPFSLCILGGILCVATSVVSAIALRKHLLTFSDDDDDEGSIAEIV